MNSASIQACDFTVCCFLCPMDVMAMHCHFLIIYKKMTIVTKLYPTTAGIAHEIFKNESSDLSLTEMSNLKRVIVHQICYNVKGDEKIHYRQKSANRSKDLQCLWVYLSAEEPLKWTEAET